MQVANLDLCKELYELSGWKLDSPRYPVWAEYVDDTSALWYPTNEKDIQHLDEVLAQFPAYDLGYLMRKLPFATSLDRISNDRYIAGIGSVVKSYKQFASTPEDAACKLAIELFKQGILTKEGKS